MLSKNCLRYVRIAVVLGSLLLLAHLGSAQSVAEQKEAVVFLFGTVHPMGAEKRPITDSSGNRTSIEVPLGTGFFVSYADVRWPGHKFFYLVTAKHVLQDADGSLLPNVRIRLNLKDPAGGREYGFIENIPVADEHGQMLWLHTANPADDIAALPLAPDENEFEFAAISSKIFLQDRLLESGDVSEGDELYFIGLMEQYYGFNRNYPLVRRGSLALLTDEALNTPSGSQKVYIAQLESWPGNSGSPVFLLGRGGPDKKTTLRFLGMVVGSFLNKVIVPLGGGQAGRQLEGGDMSNTGITCIVPAAVLLEVLDSDSGRRDRDVRARRAEVAKGEGDRSAAIVDSRRTLVR